MIHFDPARPRGIVWLASYPKSGNTWVRAFLHTLLGLVQGATIKDIDLDAVVAFGDSDLLAAYYQPHLSSPDSIRDRSAVAAARPKVQADIALRSAGLVMIKTHNAMMEYKGAPLINRAVSAGAVYVLRNPLDIAISLAHFRANSIDKAIAEMATAGYASENNDDDVYFVSGSWSEHVRTWTERPSSAVLAIRYEDMLDDPVPTFTALARHMRMPGTPEQIAQAVELTSFDKLQEAEAARGFLEKPPYLERFFRVGRAGQWRQKLTGAQVDRIVTAHGEQMARFGYLPA